MAAAEQNIDVADDDPELQNFQDALLNVVGLSQVQVTALLNQDIAVSSDISYMDDTKLTACFTRAQMPTQNKLMRLISFRN